MKPIIHAQNSAKQFGGKPDTYFPLHQLMDITKSSLPDVRHRMMLHHDKGIAIMPYMLGKQISIGSKKVSVEKIATQHIVEDLSFIPKVQQYLDLIPVEKWMKDAYLAFPTKHCEFAKKHPKIHAFLVGWLTPDPRSIIFVCNTYMPYFVEIAFGPLIGKIPTRDIVEKFISSFVEIQGLEFLLDDMRIENWMVRPALLQKDVLQVPAKKQKIIHKTVIDPLRVKLD